MVLMIFNMFSHVFSASIQIEILRKVDFATVYKSYFANSLELFFWMGIFRGKVLEELECFKNIQLILIKIGGNGRILFQS